MSFAVVASVSDCHQTGLAAKASKLKRSQTQTEVSDMELIKQKSVDGYDDNQRSCNRGAHLKSATGLSAFWSPVVSRVHCETIGLREANK